MSHSYTEKSDVHSLIMILCLDAISRAFGVWLRTKGLSLIDLLRAGFQFFLASISVGARVFVLLRLLNDRFARLELQLKLRSVRSMVVVTSNMRTSE